MMLLKKRAALLACFRISTLRTRCSNHHCFFKGVNFTSHLVHLFPITLAIEPSDCGVPRILVLLEFAGIVFGYSGLYDVFLFEVKAFSEFCDDGQSPCPAQQERLSRMFTIGATTLSGCAFVIGEFFCETRGHAED